MKVSFLYLLCIAVLGLSTSAWACEEGDAAYDAGDFDTAVAAYTACFETMESVPPDALHRRGRSHMKTGDHGQAMSDFTDAIDTDAEHAASLNSRAWVHYLNGDLDDALADIDEALALDADNPRLLDTYAHILAGSGETEDAIQAYDAGMRHQTREGVSKIQRRLADQGIDPGPVDGVYGPLTRHALEECARTRCNIWQ